MNYGVIGIFLCCTLTSLLHAQVPVPPSDLVTSRGSVVQSGKKELRGCIKVDNPQLDKIPEYRVYYQGREQRSNGEGLFSLVLEDQNIEKYSLILCKNIDQRFEQNNTISHYGVIPEKEYRYFTFKRAQANQWLAQEKRLTKKQFVIPPHAIVILIDPKCVDSLVPWDVHLPEHIIKLPVITLKKDLDVKTLRRYSAKSLLYALDSRPFHDTQRCERKGITTNPRIQLVLDR